MIANSPPCLLTDFVSLVFVPERPITKASIEAKYLTAATRFEYCLGRKPQVSDLTPATYFAFKEWLGLYFRPKPAKSTLLRHLAVWRFAHRKGVAVECPFGSAVPLLGPIGEEVSNDD